MAKGSSFPPSSLSDEWRAAWYQRPMWSWLDPLMRVGYKRPLQLSDLGYLPPKDAAELSAESLDEGIRRHTPPGTVPTWKALVKSTAKAEIFVLLLSGVFKLLGDLLGFVGPLAIAGITKYVGAVEDNETAAALGLPQTPLPTFGTLNSGWFWVIAVILAGILQNSFLQHHHELVMRAGARLRSAISLMVFRKALTVNSATRKEVGTGKIINMQNGDSNSLNLAWWFVHYIWAAPLQLAISVYLLYVQLGASAFVAVGIFVVLGPIQSRLAKMTAKHTREAAANTDTRLKLINEALSGIRILKFFAYETSFWERISQAREKELRAKRKAAFIGAFNSLILNAGPMIASLLTFLTYGYANPKAPLTPQSAFTAITLFGVLRLPLMVMPMLIGSFTSASVAAGRLLPFLYAADAEDYRTICDGSNNTSNNGGGPGTANANAPPVMPERHGSASEAMPTPPKCAAWFNDATMGWTEPAATAATATSTAAPAKSTATTNAFQLRNINISFPVGSLTQVVGAAGSGKSSLLSAILGDLPHLMSGKVCLTSSSPSPSSSAAAALASPTRHIGEWGKGPAAAAPAIGSRLTPPRIAYCSQQAWLCNGTLVENICFGLPFDLDRYTACVTACALGPDIAAWANGHQTELGEKGVTCSGGQKQRISLARCIYAATIGRPKGVSTAWPDEASSPRNLMPMPPITVPSEPSELEKHLGIVSSASGSSITDNPCTIVLLDDVLSAVDAHTGSWLFRHAICGELLGGRTPPHGLHAEGSGATNGSLTVIMATHQLQFVGSSDAIVVMEQGAVKQWGTYDHLLSSAPAATGDVARRRTRSSSSSSTTASANSNLFAAMIAERSRTSAALAQASSSSNMTASTPANGEASDAGRGVGALAQAAPEEEDDGESEEAGESHESKPKHVIVATSASSDVGEIAIVVPKDGVESEDDAEATSTDAASGKADGESGAEAWSEVDLSVGKAAKRRSTKSGVLAALADTPAPDRAIPDTKAEATVEKKSPPAPPKLMADEDRQTGAVALRLFWQYLTGFGSVLLSLTFISLVLSNIAYVGVDFWLSAWSQQAVFYVDGVYTGPSAPGVGVGDHPIGYWIGGYAALTVATVVLTFGYNIGFASGSISSARGLHAGMLKAILRAPILFFDSTPLGRLTNRFQGDVQNVDVQLPASFSSFFTTFLRILSTLIVQAIVLPWTLLAIFPLIICYLMVQLYYRATSRELKRLDSISKSPVIAHLSETLSGLSVVAAYGMQKAFASVTAARIDANNNVYQKYALVNRWLGIRLDAIGVLLVGITAIVAVATAGKIDAGLIGLALSCSVSVSGSMNWLVRQVTETESYAASVERIQSYSEPQLKVEKPPVVEKLADGSSGRPRPSWPEQGAISIRNLTVRYNEGLPPVLKNVSLEIPPGNRVGVVGRTGSGKSSLMLALFRMLEPLRGREAKDALALGDVHDAPNNSAVPPIVIDGVDISEIGLDDLRSRISIIPQEPVLFAATLRYNLDPTGRLKDVPNCDALLWKAVCDVQLGPFIKRSWAAQTAAKNKAEREKKKKAAADAKGSKAAATVQSDAVSVAIGSAAVELSQQEEEAELMKRPDVEALAFEIEEQGQNLSVGQRQLLQVARSLLRGSRVLVLDEASASISGQDDAILQETLKGLKGITLIAIAHRISTILAYDRVLVLDYGRVLEYDTPQNLLANPNSPFAKLVAESANSHASGSAAH